MNKKKCVFCDDDIEFNTFLKSDNFRCVYNLSPILPGHSLIVPKKHVESIFELSKEELKEMFELARKSTEVLLKTYETSGFDWVFMENKIAGQRIDHIHLHILPRKSGDMGDDPRKFFFELLHRENKGKRKKLSKKEVKEVVSKIKTSLK